MLKKILNAIALLFVILITFILAAASIVYFQLDSSKIHAQLSKITLTPQPESFTELYFENHSEISRATEINTPQTFSFTIHNHEHKTVNYQYEVYIQDDKTSSVSAIAKESVTLTQDQKKTFPISFLLLTPLERAKVVVNLINKKQEIHYWIGEYN